MHCNLLMLCLQLLTILWCLRKQDRRCLPEGGLFQYPGFSVSDPRPRIKGTKQGWNCARLHVTALNLYLHTATWECDSRTWLVTQNSTFKHRTLVILLGVYVMSNTKWIMWGYGASIHVPVTCKASVVQIEVHPHVFWWNYEKISPSSRWWPSAALKGMASHSWLKGINFNIIGHSRKFRACIGKDHTSCVTWWSPHAWVRTKYIIKPRQTTWG
jgi:hypothetical protein